MVAAGARRPLFTAAGGVAILQTLPAAEALGDKACKFNL